MSSKQPPVAFLNGQNYQNIVVFLRRHYSQKLGTPAISERMDTRLQKTVQHYMTEVSRLQGKKPIQVLNQEVLRETTASMDTWIKKAESAAAPTTTTIGAFSRPETFNERLFEDTSTRYENVISERMAPPTVAPPLPDFRVETLESDEDPVLLMQRMAKTREEQSRKLGLAGPPPVATPPRLEIREEPTPSAVNPVAPQAEAPPAILAPRPQDYIIPQEDIVKYRDTELNLFITSADRDWQRNTNENRYNFTVNFNTGSKKVGYGYNVAIQTRLRNIQRIEFVKAIVPIESLTQVVRVVNASESSFDTGRVVNVFSLPFVGIRIDELEPNGYSTKPEEDATFAIVQYDTTWSSDLYAPATINNSHNHINNVVAKSGYAGLIPKFLKTQRVYTPTPLATLQKLSISMERHTGAALSNDSDVWKIDYVCMTDFTDCIGLTTGCPSTTSYGKNLTGASQNSYIFVKTNKWFPYSAISEGDNIQFKGLDLSELPNQQAALDFTSFINRDAGFYVVAVAYVAQDIEMDIITDGRNNAGFSNVLILRNRFDDPSDGTVGRDSSYFGNTPEAETEFATTLCDTKQSNCALINLSRQTHIVLRVITRDMDSGANIRPDNV